VAYTLGAKRFFDKPEFRATVIVDTCLISFIMSIVRSIRDSIGKLNVYVNFVSLWNDIGTYSSLFNTPYMPRSRMDELVAIAEENDGLLT
jgi:hypothetical protein